MTQYIDARGQACPLPVVRAKKALSALTEGFLEVLVDNETSKKNLEALAKTLKIEAKSENRGQYEFAVIFAKGTTIQNINAPVKTVEPHAALPLSEKGAVVVIASEYMGTGDQTLAVILMKSFIFALTQLDILPQTVLLYNGGVKLACKNSAVLDDLKTLVQAGVSVLCCGTCLDYYGLTDSLSVGEITNMYEIVEKQMHARAIIRP